MTTVGREHQRTKQNPDRARSIGPDSAPEVRQMWDGGPYRRWSPIKTTLTPVGYAKGGFVGSYVCGGCWEPCDGVYRAREEQGWLCGPCKERVRPSGGSGQ